MHLMLTALSRQNSPAVVEVNVDQIDYFRLRNNGEGTLLYFSNGKRLPVKQMPEDIAVYLQDVPMLSFTRDTEELATVTILRAAIVYSRQAYGDPDVSVIATRGGNRVRVKSPTAYTEPHLVD